MTSRAENYKLLNGTGRIEVRGTGNFSGLYIDGKPYAFHYPDCQGSVGEELLVVEQEKERDVIDFWIVVSELPSLHRPLWEAISPLLKLFRSGTYTLSLKEWGKQDELFDWYDPGDNRAGEVYTRYPYSYPPTVIVPTLFPDKIDGTRVLEWIEEIENGARPFLVTASLRDSFSEYVIDGHHKMQAYFNQKKQTPIWRLCIAAHQSLPLKYSDWPTKEGTGPTHGWQFNTDYYSTWLPKP